ncbi:MAG: hypothetical protein EPN25_15355 [Nitrospirae bacterium]|nr:MAG: hypothetical protein EPN25_15355 [Nitrospirota bacterium]
MASVMPDNLMKIILAIIGILSVLAFVAGEIFLIGYVVSKIKTRNELITAILKIIFGVMTVIAINATPVYISQSFSSDFRIKYHAIFRVVIIGWFSSIVLFGYYNLINDYWNAYKRRFRKA